MKNLYKVYGRVRLNGRLSDKFNMGKGLKQGDSLSPLLFNILMDKICKDCNNKSRQFRTKIGHWNLKPIHIQTLLFADDIAIIASTPDKLQQLLQIWEEKLKETHMIINTNKSKILEITKEKEKQEINIQMNGETLEVVEEFTYLGTVFTKNGKITREVQQRIKKATNVYYSINHTIISKKEITEKTKLQIYNSVYKPTLTYGSESWPINTKIEKQVTAAEMKFLRRITNKTRRDHERNNKIRDDLKVTPLIQEIEKKQLKWYGHMKRMDKERIPRKCWEARMEGRKGRGRPRTSWLDSITEAGKKRGKTLNQMNTLVEDRKEWRRFTEMDPTL